MSSEVEYFAKVQHCSKEVQKEIKAMPYDRRQRLLILADLGIVLTMEHIAEFKTLEKETDIDRFARRLIFSS